MNCPRCWKSKSKCFDSRYKNGLTIRRRECLDCGYRFITEENVREKVFVNGSQTITVPISATWSSTTQTGHELNLAKYY